jgi:cation diffusion facilitator CzcD-associated flavoprotein CzcO
MITSPRITIIGAGMSSLCMAMKLQDAGIESYTVYDLASDVGGTLRDNTYPGLTYRRASIRIRSA